MFGNVCDKTRECTEQTTPPATGQSYSKDRSNIVLGAIFRRTQSERLNHYRSAPYSLIDS